jgi:hypothetical protein
VFTALKYLFAGDDTPTTRPAARTVLGADAFGLEPREVPAAFNVHVHMENMSMIAGGASVDSVAYAALADGKKAFNVGNSTNQAGIYAKNLIHWRIESARIEVRREMENTLLKDGKTIPTGGLFDVLGPGDFAALKAMQPQVKLHDALNNATKKLNSSLFAFSKAELQMNTMLADFQAARQRTLHEGGSVRELVAVQQQQLNKSVTALKALTAEIRATTAEISVLVKANNLPHGKWAVG